MRCGTIEFMAVEPIPACRSWRCFIQDNFTAVALLGVLFVSVVLVVLLMHEDKIDDKYVTWFEGFVMGIFSTWTLALKGSNSGQHQGDTIKTGDNTTVNQPIVTAPADSGDAAKAPVA